MRAFYFQEERLLYSNFGAAHALASKAANLASFVRYNAIAVSVNGEVAANLGAFASALSCANLANQYLAGGNFFAAKALNTEPLAGAVFNIFGGTACFYV
jgi:hypothetical protein